MNNQRVVRRERESYGQRDHTSPSLGSKYPLFKSIFIVLLVLAAGLWLWRLFGIETITVQGAEGLSEQSVVALARQNLKEAPLNRNLLTMSKKGLSKAMLAAEPQLAEVVVRRQWSRGITLQIKEKNLALEWETGGRYYLIDTGGNVVGEGRATQLARVVDQTNLPARVGDRVVSPAFVSFCAELRRYQGLAEFKLGRIIIQTSTSEVVVESDAPYTVKFDTSRGAEQQLRDLSRVQRELKTLNAKPAEYIDLRVEGKAYYR